MIFYVYVKPFYEINSNNETLDIDGYKCFTKNREGQDTRSKRGSGGVAVLVKNTLCNYYKIEVLDDSQEGILWLKFVNDKETFCVCTCYLPPENSKYCDAQLFYTRVRKSIYVSKYWKFVYFRRF